MQDETMSERNFEIEVSRDKKERNENVQEHKPMESPAQKTKAHEFGTCMEDITSHSWEDMTERWL